MENIPDDAIFVNVSTNDSGLALFYRSGYTTVIQVVECFRRNKNREMIPVYRGANIFMSVNEARALAGALLRVVAEAEGHNEQILLNTYQKERG